MKKLATIILAMLLCTAAFAQENNPVANEKAVVKCGNARFTVLTPKLIRMEWSENGIFEDNATLAIINRNLPVPQFAVKSTKNLLTITTTDVTLKYVPSGKFSKENLSVTFKMADAKAKKGVKTVTWHYGDEPTGNLKGTTRTLDKLGDDIRKKPLNDPFEDGILSRDGWAIVDETARPMIIKDDSDWGEWIAESSNPERLDLYIFAYGHNYTEALTDFTKVAGRIPMPPKYMFGYWWSRYWQYSDYETVNLAKQIRGFGIPVDVMVIDMDWHETYNAEKGPKGDRKDEFGQRIYWTGYTWQKDLFPDPEACLKELQGMRLKTSLNLHPASGIRPYEDQYEDFVKDYLSRTSEYDGPKDYIYGEGGYKFVGNDEAFGAAGEKAPVPFRIDQKAWADAYFNSVIRPLENQGVDFWWLDWQQWRQSKYFPSVSNTFWLNYTFFNDKNRQSRATGKPLSELTRPVIYHRWGGLGSHRYQIGFSGDTYDEWAVLKFLPYFTATASNVGYGYWGHDIGGHMQKKDHNTNPELYTRWLQYGVFTPIFKTHCTKNPIIECRIWKHPHHFEYMREAIRLRYRLSPYIYAAARQGWETGISMCRPLYYYFPEEDNAYTYDEEFFFGDNILATAIGAPADEATGLAERTMWFPGTSKDTWYDMATGKVYTGGTTTTLHYTIAENPWFVRGGAIIPMAEEGLESLQSDQGNLRLFIAPGDGRSEIFHYEDDGDSQAYATEYAKTHISKVSDASHCTITIDPREGSYKGMRKFHTLEITLEGVYAPTSVKVNGEEAQCEYDGNTLAANITVYAWDATKTTTIECTYDPTLDRSLLSGAKGLISRVVEITPDVKFACTKRIKNFLPSPAFCKIGAAGMGITRNPASAESVLKEFNPEQVIADYKNMENFPEEYIVRLEALLNL